MKYKKSCPLCKSLSLTTFLTRDQVPVHQNLLIKSQESAREASRGNLSLAVCEECGFIFNYTYNPTKLKYGEHYDNTQTHSKFFENYMNDLVQELIFQKQVRNRRIIDVGCGNGAFLRKLVEFEGAENSGYGFDPSYVGPTVDLDGRLIFNDSYYGAESVEITADIVICRHVIEHIADPLNFLYTIRQALNGSTHARVFFETPDVEWMLHNQVIWDFFYEHCSYFTAQSLTIAFEYSNFKVESVRHVFDGQYLWLEAIVSTEKPEISKNPGNISFLAKQFAKAECGLINTFRSKLQELACNGRVALWGAGAKGVTFANLADPECKLITCVVDLNPNKQGNFISGTGHPIICYKELAKYGVRTAILMNPNYKVENLSLLQKAHLDVELINITG